MPEVALPIWMFPALNVASSAALKVRTLLVSVVQPSVTFRPAVRGRNVRLDEALMAEPLLVAKLALLVTIVMAPGVLELPITLATVVQAARPTLPDPVPSVPLRKMSPPLAVMV